MKKIFLFLALAGTAVFTGCDNDDDVVYTDNDTIAPVEDITGVNFNSANQFSIVYEFEGDVFNSDVVLVYRKTLDDDGFEVWQQIPRTIYFNDGGEIDYDFNFRTTDVQIFMRSNDFADLNALPAYTQNQIFRIVRVPGYFASTIDTSDYGAVMSALESKGSIEVNKIER